MKMPVLFVGHGSPENLIWENNFTFALKNLHSEIPAPKNILVISAHWETKGLFVTANRDPEIKYDFFGFPSPLYSLKYPVHTNAEFTYRVMDLLHSFAIQRDEERGFDHGVWAPLYHLYPKANIPVTQISLPLKFSFQEHFDLGRALAPLRDEGVLILGSGNIVHNLRQLSRAGGETFPWAQKFDQQVKEHLQKRNIEALVNWGGALKEFGETAHPSTDHYLPLLYCLGASDSTDRVRFPYEGSQYGSISMRTILWSA